ncbi:MAG TPA: xanthine dehydrogenase accessory protein XdhC [Opitutaceae bacterium]|nr:xanthine dehydrogenase accessory protein XdhC [Opitutaceae bacterium]
MSDPLLPTPQPQVSSPDIYGRVVTLEEEGTSFVLVTLIETLGSVPQDAGAKILVTPSGLRAGTIGGGRVEAAALTLAQEMLASADTKPRFVNWSLKGDVNMTCGGSVKLYFEPHLAAHPWTIAIFGAGHVSQALIPVLLPLPCSITCYDARTEWLERLPRARNLKVVHAERGEDLIPTLPDDTFLLLMTKGHATDRPVLQRALAEREFPFIGVIGSDAKAAVLRRELIANGLSAERAAQFHCPVGLDFGTNHPHEIALSIAAQLLSERDRARAARAS